MLTQTVLWFITMALALFLNSCTVQIHDEQFCSPIPQQGGAVCDNFLSSNQLILSEHQWQALQMDWMSQGMSVQCTNSQAVGDYKAEIEKLCSKTPCSYDLKKTLQGLNKMLDNGRLGRSMTKVQ